MLKKTIISCAMIGAVALAVASSGGGDKKKASSLRNPDFTPIRTTNGFTLKAGPTYTGSHNFSSERNSNTVTFNQVVTYQQGNTVFILPHRSRVYIHPDQTSTRTNINALDFRIRLRK